MKTTLRNDHRRRWRPEIQPARAGFTVLEMIGVLAVMVILSAAVAEHVFKRLRDEARKAEKASLEGMAAALKSHILDTRTVPAADQLAAFIAEELEMPVGRVQATPPGFARAFLYDPAFRLGTNAPPPYTQGSTGSMEPESPRVLVVSRLDQALPGQLAFNTLWALPEGELPDGWTGDREDFFVQRIDLRSLFHRVVLASTDGLDDAPFDIDGSTVQTVAPLARTETWFMDGTPITFYYATTDLQAREFLREDLSYVFEEGRWNRHAVYGSGGWHQPFGQLVDVFLSTDAPPDAQYGTTPEAIVNEFYNYLYQTGLWAAGDVSSGVPSFYDAGSPDNPVAPQHVIVWDIQRRLSQFTSNLIQ